METQAGTSEAHTKTCAHLVHYFGLNTSLPLAYLQIQKVLVKKRWRDELREVL